MRQRETNPLAGGDREIQDWRLPSYCLIHGTSIRRPVSSVFISDLLANLSKRTDAMKTSLLALAFCGLTLPAVALADDKAKEEKKDTPVQELDATGVPRVLDRGDVNKPTVITSAEELAKAIAGEQVQARLKKAVDFTKQQILFFAWSGSGGDELTYTVENGEKGPEVVFQYKRGLKKDLAPHVRLFAIPKEATWKVQRAK
jgi:hypothetical protein